MSVVLDTIERTFTYTCDYCGPERGQVVVPMNEGLPGTWGRRHDEITERHVCSDCLAMYGWDRESFADNAEFDSQMRWSRAAAWARGQSMGPYGQGLPNEESERIHTLRDRIREVGEDRAWDEYQGVYR